MTNTGLAVFGGVDTHGRTPHAAAIDSAPRYELPPLTELPLYDSVLPNRDELDRKAQRIEETLAASDGAPLRRVDDVLEADRRARERAGDEIDRRAVVV